MGVRHQSTSSNDTTNTCGLCNIWQIRNSHTGKETWDVPQCMHVMSLANMIFAEWTAPSWRECWVIARSHCIGSAITQYHFVVGVMQAGHNDLLCIKIFRLHAMTRHKWSMHGQGGHPGDYGHQSPTFASTANDRWCQICHLSKLTQTRDQYQDVCHEMSILRLFTNGQQRKHHSTGSITTANKSV